MTTQKDMPIAATLNLEHSSPCQQAYSKFKDAAVLCQNAKPDCPKCLCPNNSAHGPACRAAYADYKKALIALKIAKNGCPRCEHFLRMLHLKRRRS